MRTGFASTTTTLCALGILALATPNACGWWAKGHEDVTEAAVAVLPPDMPDFFRDGVRSIRLSCTDPDWWVNKALPELRAIEAPNHFIDLELLRGRELPRSRDAYLALCRDLNVDPVSVGGLPYAANEWYERLVLALAEHRKRPEDKGVQAKALYIAGVLSHYTADAAQPLHTTVDFDGRTKPDGTSPRTGIHNRVDALLERVPESSERIDVQPVGDMFATVLETITEAHRMVPKVYEMENRFPNPDDQGGSAPDEVRAFARDRFKAAVKLTATAWHSAWVQSKDIPVPDWRVPLDLPSGAQREEPGGGGLHFSGTVMLATAFVLLATWAATAIFRKRHWSRTLAVVATVICFQATLILLPPAPARPTPDSSVKWDEVIADVMGRVIFAVLTVSGAQGRWIWRVPRSDASSAPAPSQDRTFYE